MINNYETKSDNINTVIKFKIALDNVEQKYKENFEIKLKKFNNKYQIFISTHCKGLSFTQQFDNFIRQRQDRATINITEEEYKFLKKYIDKNKGGFINSNITPLQLALEYQSREIVTKKPIDNQHEEIETESLTIVEEIDIEKKLKLYENDSTISKDEQKKLNNSQLQTYRIDKDYIKKIVYACSNGYTHMINRINIETKKDNVKLITLQFELNNSNAIEIRYFERNSLIPLETKKTSRTIKRSPIIINKLIKKDNEEIVFDINMLKKEQDFTFFVYNLLDNARSYAMKNKEDYELFKSIDSISDDNEDMSCVNYFSCSGQTKDSPGERYIESVLNKSPHSKNHLIFKEARTDNTKEYKMRLFLKNFENIKIILTIIKN